MSRWKTFLGAALLGIAGLQAHAATLGTSASPNPAQVGQAIELDVQVGDVADLFSYQFSLAFDPSLLRITSASSGNFLDAGGNTVTYEGDIDNAAGTLSFAYGTLLSSTPGVSGTGNLLHVTFETLAAGSSALAFSDVLFLDSAGADIAITAAAAPLAILAVPEPATWLMLGTGLIGVAALRRRQLAVIRS